MEEKPKNNNRLLLNDIELDLMRCIWEKGTAPASAIQFQMLQKYNEAFYTTVKITLDLLVKAGLCSCKEIKGRYYYTAKVSQTEVAREWHRHLNQMIFGKKPKA